MNIILSTLFSDSVSLCSSGYIIVSDKTVNEKEMVMLLCLHESGMWFLIRVVNHRHSVGVRLLLLLLLLLIQLYSLFLYGKSTCTGVIFRFSTVKQKVKRNSTEAWNIHRYVRYSAM
jgi:hypothetical protein